MSLFIRIPHHKFARALCVFTMSKSSPLSCIANLPAPPDNIGGMHAMEPCVRLQHVATVKSPVDGVPWSPHLLPHAEGEPFFAIVPDKANKSTAFSRWLFGSSKSRGENRRRVLAITRELCNMQARASFAALGAPDYAGTHLEKRKTESQSQSMSSLQTWMQRQERYPSLERICVMSFRSALFCFVLCFSLLRFDILAFRALTH